MNEKAIHYSVSEDQQVTLEFHKATINRENGSTMSGKVVNLVELPDGRKIRKLKEINNIKGLLYKCTFFSDCSGSDQKQSFRISACAPLPVTLTGIETKFSKSFEEKGLSPEKFNIIIDRK
jgi:hypothetical protein